MRTMSPSIEASRSRNHSLGSVIRPYEIPSTREWRTVEHPDESWLSSAMLPDDDGMLEVVAACGRHYTRATVADIKAGVAAPCVHDPVTCSRGRRLV